MVQFCNTVIQGNEMSIQILLYLLNKHNKLTTKQEP